MNNVIEFVAALAGLILIHETGHFIACRLFHIEVEEFGLGFPPRLMTLFEHKGTHFTLNLIPLGGFVRPRGEGDPSVEGSIEAANPWARLGVYLAGPLMNLALGIVLFTMMFGIYGMPQAANTGIRVLEVVPGAPAEQAGVQACDLIEEFNGQPLTSLEQITSLTRAYAGEEVTLTILRGEERLRVRLIPRRAEEIPPGEGAMGIGINYPVEMKPVSPGTALISGLRAAGETARLMAQLPLAWLGLSGAEQAERPVGLKGMYDIYAATKAGDVFSCLPTSLGVLNYLASITLSLAVLNLLPLPALDGGRILFVLPEILFKKRLPPRYESALNMIGFLLLLGLLLWINVQDFINPLF